MEGKSKRRVASPTKAHGRRTLMSMWGLTAEEPKPAAPAVVQQQASLKPHPFLMPRASSSGAIDLVEENAQVVEKVWRACDAAVAGEHVNWGRVEHGPPLQVPVREPTASEELAQDTKSVVSELLAAQEEAEELIRQHRGRPEELWELEEGAAECFRRANEILTQSNDTKESAIARAQQMVREGSVGQEEWVYETQEKQVEQWLKDWSQSSHGDGDDDDYEDQERAGALALEGPVGSGKSGILARAAKRMGWQVLEVNGGDVRTGKCLQAMVSEATKSGRAQHEARTVLVLEDCAVDLGDAGFGAAVESILAGARVPVAVVLEDSRVPARWPVARTVRTSRPGHARALLWAILATLVTRGRVLEGQEALLWLQHFAWDLRTAMLSLQLYRRGPLWSGLAGLPSLCVALHGSLHAALAQQLAVPAASPHVLRMSREALARRTGAATLFQYWPVCAAAPLHVAELASLCDVFAGDETMAAGLAALAARSCRGPFADGEEIEGLDPEGSAAELPRACLAVVAPHHRADAELLGWVGMLARFEGTGRRGASSSYLARACPLLAATDRHMLVRLCTFSKEEETAAPL